MANERLNQLNLTFSMRNAPRSGPTSSEAWNDSFTEVATDFASLATEWNNKLVVLLNGLPYGSYSTSIDAFENGLDGSNLWVDQSVVSTDDDLTFFDDDSNRPTTVKESLIDLYEYIDEQITQTIEDIAADTSGLTTAQKNRIGSNVFDATQTSSVSSIDGKSEYNRFNTIQLAKDIYGAGYTLDHDGNANLTNSVATMVDALLELHNGNWDDDVALSHVGTFTALQTDITTSAITTDSFAGVAVTLQDDLNKLRTLLKTLKGTGAWTSALTALYTGGADSLEELFTTTTGSGTKAALNPWGYSYTNIDGLATRLTAIQTFTGQTSLTDATPTYSGQIVNNGDSLETAIRDIDAFLFTESGNNIAQTARLDALKTFVGQTSSTDATPTYSGQIVTDGDSLETAIRDIDAFLFTESGNNIVQTERLDAIQTFIGQTSSTDAAPTYSGQIVNNGDSLETAIRDIDAFLFTESGNNIAQTERLDALETFTGQTSSTDATPTYSGQIVTDGDSLETAIRDIDALLFTESGINTAQTARLEALKTFVGQNTNYDSTPSYSSNHLITNDDSLETAIGDIDAFLFTESGINTAQTARLEALKTFTGQNSDNDSTPIYSNSYWITNGDSLETAIGKLDAQLEIATFSGLTDTPGSYTNMGGELLKIGDLEDSVVTASGLTFTESGLQTDLDIEITASGQGIVLQSPDGTRFRITVENDGALTTTSL